MFRRVNDLEEMKTGTTTLGILCKDGVVVGADQQSTMGYLVGSKTMKKIYEISDRLVMTIAGTAGDAQAIARLLKAELSLYKYREGEITTKAASTLLSNMLRSSFKSFRPDLVQLVLAGYDKDGAKLYSVDLSGCVEECEDYSFTGSGSVIALGVLEDSFRPGMTSEEGVKLIVRAIRAAKERDVYTGGKSIDILIVNEKGIRKVPEEQIRELLGSRDGKGKAA